MNQSTLSEDRRQIDNRAKLLNDTLVRKVYPWVANEHVETDWEELVYSFSLASRQIDDLSGNLRSVYSLQVPTPKKPFPQDQFQIPQILSTMVDKEDREKILVNKTGAEADGESSAASEKGDKDHCDAHNQAVGRVLMDFNQCLNAD